jgi:hypothetical protein
MEMTISDNKLLEQIQKDKEKLKQLEIELKQKEEQLELNLKKENQLQKNITVDKIEETKKLIILHFKNGLLIESIEEFEKNLKLIFFEEKYNELCDQIVELFKIDSKFKNIISKKQNKNIQLNKLINNLFIMEIKIIKKRILELNADSNNDFINELFEVMNEKIETVNKILGEPVITNKNFEVVNTIDETTKVLVGGNILYNKYIEKLYTIYYILKFFNKYKPSKTIEKEFYFIKSYIYNKIDQFRIILIIKFINNKKILDLISDKDRFNKLSSIKYLINNLN